LLVACGVWPNAGPSAQQKKNRIAIPSIVIDLRRSGLRGLRGFFATSALIPRSTYIQGNVRVVQSLVAEKPTIQGTAIMDHIFAAARAERRALPRCRDLDFSGDQGLHDAHVALNVSDSGFNALVAKNPLIPRNPERRKIDNDTWNGNANFFFCCSAAWGHTHKQQANPKRNAPIAAAQAVTNRLFVIVLAPLFFSWMMTP